MPLFLKKELEKFAVQAAVDNDQKSVEKHLNTISEQYKKVNKSVAGTILLHGAMRNNNTIVKLAFETGVRFDSGLKNKILLAGYNKNNSTIFKLALEYGASVNKSTAREWYQKTDNNEIKSILEKKFG